MNKLALGVLVCAAALALSLLDLRDASACGMFFTRPLTEAEIAQKLPYLAVERVLLAWDPATQTEDFVRETRFEKADQAFGFVVPVPSQPEVFAVDQQPFDDLAHAFPYVQQHPQGFGSGKGMMGAGGGGGAPAVVVLSEQRIGSFTAFVLSARDSGGLADWLAKNGFQAPPAAQPWLDHYVRMGFSYVAFRYDAPAAADAPNADAGAKGGMTSQTVRIRFKTPLPYYPYLEPSRPGGPPLGERDLLLWFASRDERVPVAAFKSPDGTLAWKQPWDAGGVRHVTAKQVRDVSPSLADIVTGEDDAPWVVVPYRDGKSSREGWGDVLLAPAQPLAADDAALAALWPLLPMLDPRLEGDIDDRPPPAASLFPPVATPAAAVPSASAASSGGAAGHGCSVSESAPPGHSGAGATLAFIAVATALALVRRRRRLVLGGLLTLCACSKPAPTTERAVTAAADASAIPDVPPAPAAEGDRTARERAVVALLLGRQSASRIPVDAAIRMASPAMPKVQEIAATVVGRLPTEVVQRIVRQNFGRFRLCYENGLRKNPGLKGKVAVRFGIDRDGNVGKPVDAGSDLADGPTVQCIVRGFGNLSFPQPESGSVSVTYRMSLDPPG